MYKQSAIARTIAVLLFMTSSALAQGGNETGQLALTVEQYDAVVARKIDSLLAAQIGKHDYSALQSELDRYNIKPLANCSDLYKKFMDQNRATFQNWANKNCRDYFGIWCCPYRGCRFFIVKPNILCNWRDPIYIPKIPVWEWPQSETGIPGK